MPWPPATTGGRRGRSRRGGGRGRHRAAQRHRVAGCAAAGARDSRRRACASLCAWVHACRPVRCCEGARLTHARACAARLTCAGRQQKDERSRANPAETIDGRLRVDGCHIWHGIRLDGWMPRGGGWADMACSRGARRGHGRDAHPRLAAHPPSDDANPDSTPTQTATQTATQTPSDDANPTMHSTPQCLHSRARAMPHGVLGAQLSPRAREDACAGVAGVPGARRR